MRLLPKNEIVKVKSLERKLEIDEGAKLAKKVDSLRSLLAKEQSDLIKFRNESIRKVKSEIDIIIVDRDKIKEEVNLLELKKKDLLIPLDEKWNEVNKEQEKLNNFAQELNKKHVNLEQNKKDFEVDKIHLDEEKQRIYTERESSIKSLAEAEENKEKSKRELSTAQNTHKKVIEELEEKQKQLLVRESNIASAERDIKNKNDNLEKEYQFINKEKIRLADQRATLERAMKRIKK